MNNERIEETVTIKENLNIKGRFYYSIQHIQSAALFSRLSLNIEKTIEPSSLTEEIRFEYKAYVTSSVLCAAAFLEATINEFFSDCMENPEKIKLKKEQIEIISNMYKLNVPKTKVLDKYQIALALLYKELFDAGKLPYQDIALLIKLRNAIIHYVPEWITYLSDDPIKPHTFEEKLGNKFPPSPFSGAFYPDKLFSHGCSKWAVNSSIKFTDEFFKRMELKPTYDHLRHNLVTE